uniref:Integrase catalytic domain-containing protein n=1 Tax=Paramormyrops kingsleyae TaxID=1676925 RepID=A0A3B3RKZ9_9TELE
LWTKFRMLKSQQKPSGLLVPIMATYPWEYVGVDFVGPLPRTAQGNAHILVFVDYFTKWVEVSALREATAAVVADRFMDNIVAWHGAPKYLISDRGTPFVNAVFDTLLRTLGTEHRLTTAYHPQTNMTERVNRTLKTAIRAFVGSLHRSWDKFIPQLLFALRTAPHASTGDTIAFLLYGRDLATPLDLLLAPALETTQTSMQEYRDDLVSKLGDAYDHVQSCLAESPDVQKKHYDQRHQHVSFGVNDLVKVRNHPRSDGLAGFAAKLAPVFRGPYRVVKKVSEVNYKLVSLHDGKDAGVFHVGNMRPFPHMGLSNFWKS